MAESMNDLGNIYDITGSSYAKGASAYGSVIVGAFRSGSGVYDTHAFKYANGIMIDLGTLGGAFSSARAVSADGAVIVGDAFYTVGGTTSQAFKYTNGVMTGLGFLGEVLLALPLQYPLMALSLWGKPTHI
jgi:probable HAF family extracellular repeat protein